MTILWIYVIVAFLVLLGMKVWNHNCTKDSNKLDGDLQVMAMVLWPGVAVSGIVAGIVIGVNTIFEKIASCIKIKVDRTKKG